MRTMALITVATMFVLLLYLLKVGVYAEQVAHYGQMVDNDGGPDDCTVCHDGLIAPGVNSCTLDCGSGNSHPILKYYPPLANESSYAPVESLQEKGIRLYNGQVSCISCHDLKKSTKYYLTMDNGGSALCFGCHII